MQQDTQLNATGQMHADAAIQQFLLVTLAAHHVADSSKDTQASDLHVAGFLCQRFFAAGKGCGLQDACGTVFFGCADYIATKQPRKFVLENVKRILSRLSQR